MAIQEQSVNQSIEFLRAEIGRMRKSLTATCVIGVIVIALVTCYMSGVVYLVRGMLEPMTAARMIRNAIEMNLPMVLTGTEEGLCARAVPLANELSASLMAMMPELRKQAEARIEETHQEMLPLLSHEIRDTLKAYVTEHEDTIRAYVEENKDPEFCRAMVAAVSDDLQMALERELRLDSGTGLAMVKSEVYAALEEINANLSELLEKDAAHMTHSERLQRRLIASWVAVLDEMVIEAAKNGRPLEVELPQ